MLESSVKWHYKALLTSHTFQRRLIAIVLPAAHLPAAFHGWSDPPCRFPRRGGGVTTAQKKSKVRKLLLLVPCNYLGGRPLLNHDVTLFNGPLSAVPFVAMLLYSLCGKIDGMAKKVC